MTTETAGTIATEERAPEKPTDSHVTVDDAVNPQANSEDPADQAGAATTDDSAGANKGNSADPDTTTRTDPKPRDRAAERRFGKMRKQLKAERDGRQQDRAKIAELEQQLADGGAETPDDTKKPRLRDFDSDEEYAEAHGKWKAGTTAKPAATTTPKRSDPHANAAPAASDTELVSFQERATKELGDVYLDVAEDSDNHAVSPVMGDFILDSDQGPKIYVHLANNPDLALKIYKRTEGAARKMLETLETKAAAGKLDLAAPEEDPKDDNTDTGTDDEPTGKQPRRTTKAPKPPADDDASGTDAPNKDPANESMDEYSSRRRKEEARERGRMF